MIVTEVHDRGAACKVGVAPTVSGVNPDALSPFGDDFGVESEDRGDE